ncbi:MAG TPA: cytochrome c oxidase subunit 3 family protein [Chthoniobacterales bacterium]|nr:cytochrome c oxidase subunit 3 family protein [Chthoniobacterales bacterium]
MSGRTIELAEQFEDIAQQRAAATLGMWIFLATEVMFFGGLFLAFAVARFLHADAFNQGAKQLDVLAGSINTAILLTSSFTTALAVAALKQGKKKCVIALLLISVVLGSLFLTIKGYEYHEKWTAGLFPGANFTADGPIRAQLELFFLFYFILTGLHGIHLLVALGIALAMLWFLIAGRITQTRYTPIETSALYWHFVDIVWVFVFPILYLIGGR